MLDIQDRKSLLISKYGLDCQPYNTSQINVTWETCSLRSWLNNAFLAEAFSDDEKSQIPVITIKADKNPIYYNTNPGNDTSDQVFLLSVPEVDEFFSAEEEGFCDLTGYASNKIQYLFQNNARKPNSSAWTWWLRTPGSMPNLAVVARSRGEYNSNGLLVNKQDVAVRPAIWVNWE